LYKQTNKHNAHTLLVANVSTERLGKCGVIFYRNDLLGNLVQVAHSPPFIIVKLIFTVFAINIFGNVKSNIAFAIARNNLLSIQFTCL